MVKSKKRLLAENNLKEAKKQLSDLKKDLADEKRSLSNANQRVRVIKSFIVKFNKDIKQTQDFISKQTKILPRL